MGVPLRVLERRTVVPCLVEPDECDLLERGFDSVGVRWFGTFAYHEKQFLMESAVFWAVGPSWSYAREVGDMPRDVVMIQGAPEFVARKLNDDELVLAVHNKGAQNVELHKPAKSL
jgi:hypothetical protein